MINAGTQLCMVIGHPVGHSLSPTLHNAGYRGLGIENDFVYVACDVKPEEIADFVKGVRAMGVRGVSCTIPHKEIIVPHLDEINPTAAEIGAVNTVLQKNGRLYGFNTDWIGVVEPLKKLTELKGKRAAVIGAGGAARAMVCGLIHEGALVTVYNRTVKKAEALAEEFGCQASPLSDADAIKQVDIICNATSLGMRPHEDQIPLDESVLTPHQIVFDAVYDPYETRLLKVAKSKGARIIHGTEMLLYQGMAQFKLFTDHEAPETAMRKVLLEGIRK